MNEEEELEMYRKEKRCFLCKHYMKIYHDYLMIPICLRLQIETESMHSCTEWEDAGVTDFDE